MGPPRDDDGRARALVIVNDQPYGSARSYNALRLAGAPAKRDGVMVRVFLPGDAVAGQTLPDGHYHLDRMLAPLLGRGEGSLAAAPASTRGACARISRSRARGAPRWRS